MKMDVKQFAVCFAGLLYFPLGFSYFRGFNSTKIIFYYGTNGDLRTTYDLDEASSIPTNQNFNLSRKTLLYAHGFTENQKSESIRTIVKAYARRGDHNILILDWAELAGGSYLTNALPNISRLGQRLAAVIKAMLDGGLRLETFHLVGHSLGAHLVGYAGREIMQKHVVLPRITGLDPAFPGFYIIPLGKPLTLRDAKFVDIIHTDAYFYGAPFPGGHVDFWPNGGIGLQPGCTSKTFEFLSDESLCSHWKSWRFWAESVSLEYEETFLAIKAQSWQHFKQRIDLYFEDITLMGIDCPVTARGNYYLTTNPSPPFARSKNGLKYP